MRVLVAGGTGLIGRHAAVELLRRGHQVVLLARRPPALGVLPQGASFVAGDLESGDLEPVLNGFDGVVNAAGTDYRVMPRGSSWEYYRQVNVEAPLRFFTAAERVGVRRGVFVTSFYHALRPSLAAVHPYIRSRLESEERVLSVVGQGLSLSIVQPPFIVGTLRGRPSLADEMARWVGSSWPLLSIPGGSNFMSAVALGEAIASSLENGRPGSRYLVGDENLSWTEFIRRFARVAQRERRVWTLPRSAVLGASAGLLAWEKWTGRESGVRPLPWARFMTEAFHYSASDARKELGYRCGDLDEAMREAVRAQRGE